jgi:hypothetical protein
MTCSCDDCGEWVHSKRWELGYRICRECGEQAAARERRGWTIVGLPKGHYTRVTKRDDLLHLNQKTR